MTESLAWPVPRPMQAAWRASPCLSPPLANVQQRQSRRPVSRDVAQACLRRHAPYRGPCLHHCQRGNVTKSHLNCHNLTAVKWLQCNHKPRHALTGIFVAHWSVPSALQRRAVLVSRAELLDLVVQVSHGVLSVSVSVSDQAGGLTHRIRKPARITGHHSLKT